MENLKLEEGNLNLEEASFSFSQDGNCLVDKDECEFLEIKCVSDIGIDRNEKCFYILKTEGWSIDNVGDLQKLFDRIHKALFPKS
jgi:hypothetical protein